MATSSAEVQTRRPVSSGEEAKHAEHHSTHTHTNNQQQLSRQPEALYPAHVRVVPVEVPTRLTLAVEAWYKHSNTVIHNVTAHQDLEQTV